MQALGTCVGFFGAVPCFPCPNPFKEVNQGPFQACRSLFFFLQLNDIQDLWVLSNASATFTSPSTPAWSKSTSAPNLSESSTSRFKSAPSVVRRSSRVTTSTSKCTKPLRSPGPSTFLTQVHFCSDSVIYFQITNPYRAAFGISDLRTALIERAQTTLRHVVGARAVQSVIAEREAIAFEIAEIVGDVADKWGVSIEGILIKDIVFSPEVAASLSSAAQQKRIGESKVIAARAEVDAARLMRQAADILASPAAMQIRQLEALQQMAKSANSKVVFVPMQLQSDITHQLQAGAGSATNVFAQSGELDAGIGPAGRMGILSSVADL